MSDIIEGYRQSCARVAQARSAHSDFLEGVQARVEPLWQAFQQAFGDLAERAEKAGIEWIAPDPRGNGLVYKGWATNGYLVSITQDGENVVFTMHQSFRNEIDESEATIPLRFLGEDGMAVMQAEAAQLGAGLDHQIAEQAQEAARLLQEHERAEFQRLSGIYGGQASKA